MAVITTNDLLGCWKLIAYYREAEGRIISYPFGKDALGYLFYHPGAYMSVEMMNNHRSAFAGDTIENASKREKCSIADEHFAYCGKFEVVDNTVLHHLELCSYPNWIGTTKQRTMRLEGNRLTLITPLSLLNGREYSAVLEWEKL